MEKKKLKLSISKNSKKTISSIEQAKSQSKNTVLIEKKTGRFGSKQPYSKQNFNKNKSTFSPTNKKPFFSKNPSQIPSDFENICSLF